MSDQKLSLSEEISKWLSLEGYPLEFKTSRVFAVEGFRTTQGFYVQDDTSKVAREIDVLADADVRFEDKGFFRVSQVIECKWSKDKPWVIFTSSKCAMHPSACIAQSIGSLLGEAVTFCEAGESVLQSLQLFKNWERGGFAGRRAFEKHERDKQDLFYHTVQGTISNAVLMAKSFDNHMLRPDEAPQNGIIIFPVIVVDGELFEAYYDHTEDKIKIVEAKQVRVYWRGSVANQRAISPIDIVSASCLDEFARIRASDIKILLKVVQSTIAKINRAFNQKKFEELEIKPGPRGYTGLPLLLANLYLLSKSTSRSPQLKDE